MDSELTLRVATPADAPELLRVIRAAFSARPPVDPPAEALSDDVADIERALREGAGVVAEMDGDLVAGLLIDLDGHIATLRRVSVAPSHGGNGLARTLVEGAFTVAADLGGRTVELMAREEFPHLIQWWRESGFEVVCRVPHGVRMGRALPVAVDVPTADDMHQLGRRLAQSLRKGDLIVATGDLGAGKTTLTQGIAAGLGVEGAVISPTFVISRIHRHPGDGPDLVHVDAYRLGAGSELADIDLDATLPDSVTLVEWGRGLAEWLADDRLEIDIVRGIDADTRTVFLTGVGPRWAGALDYLRERP